MLNYKKLSTVHQSIDRGKVWCTKCGHSQKIDPSKGLSEGWPKCCGYTMTIDSPDERRCFKCQHKMVNNSDGWCYIFEGIQPNCQKHQPVSV
jgi:hypothetical protein